MILDRVERWPQLKLAVRGCGARFERAALRETLVRFWARIGKTDAQ